MSEWIANFLEWLLDFSNILNASIAASWMLLAVIVLRYLLKKAPRWIHVALWGLVAVRLLLPFSIESPLSLIPSAETIPHELLRVEGTQLQEPAYLDVVANPIFPNGASVEIGQTIDRVQVHMTVMTLIWLTGIAVLLVYTFSSYWYLRRKVREAVILRDNIFQSENAGSPFVLGIIKPRIYLPYKIEEQTLVHVIAHEQAHIQRKDHWWKPLGFLLLTIHWFNPLMWLGYVLFCRDIELACDEKVIKDIDNEQRANYSQALVACSVKRPMIAACPLAFGEVGVKERVKSVLNYRKPAFWIIVVAVIACIVLAVCFMTNPKTTFKLEKLEIKHYWFTDASQKAEVTVTDSQTLSNFYELLNYDGRNWNDNITKLEPEEYFVLELNDDLKLHINLLREDVWYMDEMKNGQFIHETSVDAKVVDALREMLSENTGDTEKWDERPMLVIDGKKYMDFYKPVSTLPYGYSLTGTLTAEQAYNTGLEGTQYYTNPNEPDIFYTYQLCGTPTSIDEVDSENRNWQYLRWISADADALKERKLTLDDVRWLAQKGEALSWDDFDAYQGTDIGSGLYIMQYVIDDLFDVLVGGGSREADPEYVHLRNRDINAWVDIRTDDIDAFIKTYSGSDNYAGSDIPSDTDNLITVLSSGMTIHPFLSFAYSEKWTENGFLCVDGGPVLNELTEWSEATYLPALVYSEDFTVSYADKVSFRYVIPFDESKNQMDHLYDITELENLDPGRYFIGIVVNQEGDYIEPAKQSECTGWTCLFRLTVE